MKKEQIENFKNYSSTVFIWVLIVGTILFTINWGLTDWDEVSTDFSQSTLDLLDGVHCEIDYKEFHYEGMCIDRDEVFDFVKELYNYSNTNNVSNVRMIDSFGVADVPRIRTISYVDLPNEETCYRSNEINDFIDKCIRS